jgi:serine/threonine-protein kinase
VSATSFPGSGDFGDYRIDALIGRGGMGVVYRAWQRRMNRPVALKVLPAELAGDPLYRRRFGREAAALAALDSPHVIRIYDHGEHDGNLFLAMQLVAGPDLGTLLREGPLPPRRALRIVGQIATALADAHAVGVVHRDVKPGNVLVRTSDDEDFVYLCDFGIARSAADITAAPDTAGVIGTLAYLSPERLDGEPATPASDVYALGCLLWTLLTGAPPYQGSQPQVIVGHLQGPVPQLEAPDRRTRMLNALLAAMLAKQPARRAALGAVRQQIRDVLAESGDDRAPRRLATTIPDGAGTVGEPTPRMRWSRPGARAVAVLAVVLLAAGAGLWWVLADPARTADDRLRRATPVGLVCAATAVADSAAAAGALAQLVCPAGGGTGELRLYALGWSGSVDGFLRSQAGQEPSALLAGDCPADLPARQDWARDGHSGVLLCYVLGANARYAWTVDDLDVVAVLDGSPQAPYPRDLGPLVEFFDGLRYPT